MKVLAVAALLLGLSMPAAAAQMDAELAALNRSGDLKRMEEIALTGNVRAQTWLALMLQNRSRRAEAKQWWTRAAEQGDAWAIGMLVQMHHADGEDEEAAYWLQRGAEVGHASLQVGYAHALLSGRGVPKDERQAVRWFTAAVVQGNEHAYLPLAELYATGRGVDHDPIEAFALATIAEAVLRSSDFEPELKAAELRGRLTQQLSAEEREAGLIRANATRADLPALQAAKRKTNLMSSAAVLGGVAAVLTMLVMLGWLLWRVIRFMVRRPS